jgi:hypothetical protein
MSVDTNPNIEDVVTVVDNLDSDAPVAMEIEDKLTDVTTADPQQAHEIVSDALDLGVLEEDQATRGFGGIRLAEPEDGGLLNTDETTDEEPDSTNTNPGSEPGESGTETDTPDVVPASAESWADVAFEDPSLRTWAPAQIERDQWMCRSDSKAPYAPWTDSDAPVECGRDHEDREGTVRCSTCDHGAGYKWGSDGSREYVHTDHDTAREWSGMDPSLSSDLAYIQYDEDPFAFVDGDDVRDPDTGEIHPAFIAILEHLGITYADVSTSGSGVHAPYRGEIPLEGVTQAMFEIDDEPFGSNEDVPEVEIYDSKHVCIATGDHLPGSGTEINSWDEDALAAILQANGITSSPEPSADTSVNLTDHTPTATTSDETTDEIRDIFAALDRINAQRVAHDTIVASWNDSAGTSAGNRAFAPTWGQNANGTANIVDDEIWQDTGGNGYGGVDVMAAIDCPDLPSYDENTQPRDLSGADWFRALEHLRELGYAIPELESDASGRADPTAAVPLEMLASLDLDDARRFASKHDIEWATTREARERLRDEVFEVMTHGDTKVIDAPTALGKSYTVATEPWIRRESTTGGAPVVHTHETKKARDQAAQESDDAGYDYAVLEGRSEACPVAAGEYDPLGREGTVDNFDTEELPETVITIDGTPASDFFDTACEDRGLPFSVAHKYLENHKDQDVDMPCCAGDDNNECPAVTQWDGLPRTESGEPAVDVIHCTHQFAHVPSLRNGTNLIFDERPDFREDLTHRQVRKAISAYLTVSGAPVTTFEEFVTRALNGDEKRNEHAQHATLRDAFGYEPDREWYLETEGAHTLAPALTRAVYYALQPDEGADDEHDAQDANGRYSATVPHEPPRLDANASDESGWNRTYVSVTLDANNTIRTVRNSPSLNGARSVIGLDAHPAQTQWELNVHPDIETSAVLDPAERAMWRRFERGLLTVGVGDATRPLTSGEYFDREGSEAFFAALRDRFGEDFRTAITAASVESETKDILREVGVEDPDTMHYGEEKSRNDFAGEDIGALNGCIDPGDDFVLDLLAERGLDAAPETTTDDDGNEVRAHGRGFVGPDADAAAELLASVREQHIAQGAGRLARDADDPEDRAIVFVRTDAAPPGFLDMQVPGVEWLATGTQTEIIDELRQRSSATTREIADAVGCSKEHARDTLKRLVQQGIVNVHENAGGHGAHLYRVLAGIATQRPGEHVDLSPGCDDTTNDGVCRYSTWSLAVSSVTPVGSVTNRGSSTTNPADQSQPPDMLGVDSVDPPG